MSAPDRTAGEEYRTRERVDRGSRVLTDEEGHVWRVREVSFADTGPSLIFECEMGFRRVRAYPSDWLMLGDTELLALSWKT